MRGNYFPHLLLSNKLRFDRKQRIRESVEDQESFDELFRLVFHHERMVAQQSMRAIIMLAKANPEFLVNHTDQILTLLRNPDYKEIKSMVIQLISCIDLTDVELKSVWHILTYLSLNQNEQKTIRLNALQSMYELTNRHETFVYDLHDTLNALTYDLTPSIQSKVLKLRTLLNKTGKITA